MNDTLYNEESLRRYLLGQMDEAEQTRNEEKYFADPDYFALLQIVEGELIDAYVCGQLSAAERQNFESLFLQSPDRRQRVELIRAVKLLVAQEDAKKASEQKTRKPSLLDFLRWRPLYLVPLTASLILTFGFAFLFLESAGLRRDLDQSQQSDRLNQHQAQVLQEELNQERQRVAELAKDLEATKPPTDSQSSSAPLPQNPQSPVMIATLFPYGVRSEGGLQKIQLAANTEIVRLKLPFVSADLQKISATLKVVGGQELFTKTDLPVTSTGQRQQTVWSLPVKSLHEADYVISLKTTAANGEVGEVAKYAFRLIKRRK
ncbi:MAG: hypothetical protein HY231_02880 [Acidobacteria bacterium]|nr:hypothetical protein [Acidobacteriota bacterium]